MLWRTIKWLCPPPLLYECRSNPLTPCTCDPVQMGPSPVRSSRGAPASPLKSDVLKQTPAVSQSSPAPSPQKALNKAPMSPSPLKNQGPSRRLDSNAPNASPSKLDLPAKPARTDPSIPSRERVCVAAQASTTPQHQKASSGTPGKIKTIIIIQLVNPIEKRLRGFEQQ